MSVNAFELVSIDPTWTSGFDQGCTIEDPQGCMLPPKTMVFKCHHIVELLMNHKVILNT